MGEKLRLERVIATARAFLATSALFAIYVDPSRPERYAPIAYAVIAGFLNTTLVEVGQNELSVRHFPLPWAGNRVLAAGEISQIHCEQRISRNNNSTSTAYGLFATLKSGVKLQLASGFTDPAEPKTIERLIEERLGIKDVRVVGEYRG